jgi:hypothetical protein
MSLLAQAIHRERDQGVNGESGEGGRSSAARDALLIAALALLLRVAWLSYFGTVANNEGGEYARLAENLAAGNGYVGVFGGPHIIFPPLYPILIALVTPLAGGAVAAAFALNVVCGTTLAAVMYRIGVKLGGRLAGVSIGALTAVHGLFIGVSASTFSESPFFLALGVALLCLMRLMEHWKHSDAVLAGAALGCAYLTRPEALLYAAVSFPILIVAVKNRPELRRRAATCSIQTGSAVAGWIRCAQKGRECQGKARDVPDDGGVCDPNKEPGYRDRPDSPERRREQQIRQNQDRCKQCVDQCLANVISWNHRLMPWLDPWPSGCP